MERGASDGGVCVRARVCCCAEQFVCCEVLECCGLMMMAV